MLALAGLIGAGRTELLETIFGLRHPDAGQIKVKGGPLPSRSPRDAVRHGLGLVPEERREAGLVLGRSVSENLLYAILDRVGSPFHLRRKRMQETVEPVHQTHVHQNAVTIHSGWRAVGRQSTKGRRWQVAGCQTRILLLDEPTRGIDVNAKAEIYRLIDELAQSGVAVIVASSELPEVLGISDRVLVLAQRAADRNPRNGSHKSG